VGAATGNLPTMGAATIPPVAVAVLAVAGFLVGLPLSRRLADGGYRLDGEVARLPPAVRVLVPPTISGLWVAMGLTLPGRVPWSAVPAFLLLAVVATGCVWVDLDVHRLPDGLTIPGLGLVGGLLLIPSAADHSWLRLVAAAAAAAAIWIGLTLLSLAPGGGLGGGDVAFGSLLGGALAWVDPWLAALGLGAGFVVSGMAAAVLVLARRVGLRSPIALGPGLAAGCLGVLLAVPGVALPGP
jgi:leader peptidase (prepilin peptidase)/N-methyltransferase